jgi:hypothetical protein
MNGSDRDANFLCQLHDGHSSISEPVESSQLVHCTAARRE